MDVGFYYMSNAAGRLVARHTVAAGMTAMSRVFAGTLSRRADMGGERKNETDARG